MLPVIVFGWPTIIASMVIAAIAVVRRAWTLFIAALLLSSPSVWYLSNTPRFRYLSFLTPASFLAGAVAARRRLPTWILWLLLLPAATIYIWLGLGVISQ